MCCNDALCYTRCSMQAMQRVKLHLKCSAGGAGAVDIWVCRECFWKWGLRGVVSGTASLGLLVWRMLRLGCT